MIEVAARPAGPAGTIPQARATNLDPQSERDFMATVTDIEQGSKRRIELPGRTLRQDRWWVSPLITFLVLLSFIVYATVAAFANKNYYKAPYISPFYSPCISANCTSPKIGIIGDWWKLSPALLILIFPLGFRMTCYYYRKAYYRAFWQSPPACAVGEPRKRYSGETRFPLILQNTHRYWFYAGLIFNVILTYDAFVAFDFDGEFGMGLGTVVLLINATLLWLYSLSCHSCRHILGGRLNHFSKHPVRYWMWGQVSKLNARHMQLAWASLIFVALTDLYVRLVASGTISDLRFF
ncbi:MAG: hypothetical protein NVSMB13_14930 [Mycobacteriales bacterium]